LRSTKRIDTVCFTYIENHFNWLKNDLSLARKGAIFTVTNSGPP
jgi:hypothetical protein